jgi:kumamolisin
MILAVLLMSGFTVVRPVTAETGTCQNLIANGSMESNGGWTAQTNGTYPLFSNYQAYAGIQSAYMAGVNSAEDTLSQTTSIPADYNATLSFWWLINSEEVSPGWDGMTVQVANGAGTPLHILFAASDRSASLVWQQTTLDLSEFAGQTIQLQFRARTDASLATDFYIDNVELMVCEKGSASESPIYLPILSR